MPDAPVRPAPVVSPDWTTPPFGAERPIHPQHGHTYVWQVLYEDGTSLWEIAGGQHHVAADIDPSRAVGVRLLPLEPGYTGHAVQLRRTAPQPDGSAPSADGRRPYVRRTTSWTVPALGPEGPVTEAVRCDWHVIGWERPDGTGVYLYVAPSGDAFLADTPHEV